MRVYPPPVPESDKDRAHFWKGMNLLGPHGCWEWTRLANDNGYGLFDHARGRWYTHRLAYRLTHDPIPSGLVVMHKCDNPLCCNPAHLKLGTHADNVRDKMQKGRGAPPPVHHWRGESQWRTHLKDGDVVSIRERAVSGEPYSVLAREHDVSVTCIQNIVTGKRWKHVGGPIRNPRR